MDHVCHRETEIALLRESVKGFNRFLEQIDERTRQTLQILQGDAESPGLLTRMALIEQSDRRKWWWLGAVSAAILGIALKTLI